MDLSKISDQDLLALNNKQYDKLSNEGLTYLHQQNQGTPKGPDNAHSAGETGTPGLMERMVSKIPGMQERYDKIQAYRNTPEFKQQYPQPITGMEDPAYQALGLAGPESAMSVVKSIPKLGEGLTNFFKPAAQRAEVFSKVKNVAELEPYVQGKVNEANQMFNARNVGTPMATQKAILSGKTVKVDPKALSGLSPEIDSMVKGMTPGADGLAEIPATDALPLREQLNKVAGWKQSPMDPNKASAIDQQVSSIHQNLSDQFSSIDPAMDDISKGMQQSYTLQKNTLGSAGRNPIKAVTRQDLTGQSRLAQFDQASGSNLQQLGKNINTAKNQLQTYSPQGLKKLLTVGAPKEAFDMAATPASRAYDTVGSSISNAPAATDSTKLFYLLKGLQSQTGSNTP